MLKIETLQFTMWTAMKCLKVSAGPNYTTALVTLDDHNGMTERQCARCSLIGAALLRTLKGELRLRRLGLCCFTLALMNRDN